MKFSTLQNAMLN